MVKTNRYLVMAAAASLLLLASCKDGAYQYDASGTFEAVEVLVSSESSGRILSLNVEEGMPVQPGTVYGMIDTVQLRLQKKQLEAGEQAALSRLTDSETQTAYIKQQIEANRREAVRVKNLIEADAANTKQLDDINTSIDLLEAQLASTEADIERNNKIARAEALSYRTQIASIEESLRRCRIESPISGTVLVKYAEAGELTGAGKPIFKVADVKNMILRAYVTSDILSKVSLGQKAKVYAGTGEGGIKEYEGVVSWISSESEFTPKAIQTQDERSNLVYAVKISFENDGFAKIGMYGDVKF